MEFVADVLAPKIPKCDPNLVPVVSLGTEMSFIKINGTEFQLDEKQALKFLQALDHRRFTSWTYSDHHDGAEKRANFSANWTLLLSFVGAVLTFYAFGSKQREEAYNKLSVCLLNVFRLSIGQPLRKDPRKWSMKFVLLSWVLFQMHASIIYQGVLMSYRKSYESHSTDVLVIPNECLIRFQRLFETGQIFKVSRKRGVTNTLRASSQTQLLLQVLLVGWVASALVLLIEIWTHRNVTKCRKWQQRLEKYPSFYWLRSGKAPKRSERTPPMGHMNAFYIK